MDLISYDCTTKFITNECLAIFERDEVIPVMKLAMHLLEFPKMKMHCPQHHYLISAAMLTAAYKVQGRTINELRDDLMEAMMRAKNVLPGFCGLYCSCCAAVGLGIFASIFMGTTPCSVKTWSLTNRIVAESLMKMLQISEPWCCKRSSFIAIQQAEKFVKNNFKINLGETEIVRCKFSDRNPECKKEGCPFFQVK